MVPPMISSWSSCWEVLDDLAVGERIAEALGVREVGAEHQPIGGQAEVEETLRVGLVEDVHVDVPLEHLEGILVEEHRRLLVGPWIRWTKGRIQFAQYSTGMNFSLGKRVARPWPMIDAMASCTTTLVGHHRLERRRAVRLEGQHLAGDALPLVRCTAGSPGHPSACRRRCRDARTSAQNGSNSCSANDLRPCQVGTGATRIRKILAPCSWMYCELLEGAVGARGQADDRRGVDRVGVHVGPVLVHPLVERVDDRDRERRGRRRRAPRAHSPAWARAACGRSPCPSSAPGAAQGRRTRRCRASPWA